MTSRIDIDQVLDGYLADGPERVGDQALLRALDAIDQTKQRRDLFATIHSKDGMKATDVRDFAQTSATDDMVTCRGSIVGSDGSQPSALRPTRLCILGLWAPIQMGIFSPL